MTNNKQHIDYFNTNKSISDSELNKIYEYINSLSEKFEEKSLQISFKDFSAYINIHNFKRYKTFKIKKKTGGFRKISSPTNGLCKIQTLLNKELGYLYTPSNAAHGFTENRSIVSNANVHIGHNYVYNIDLSDFFFSINKSRVWKRLTLHPFNYTESQAELIARICCIKIKNEDKNSKIKYRYVLPQGAPTSPLLTNAVCDILDRRLTGLANRFGLHYTRYADDITFSSMHNVYQDNSDFIKELHRIINDQKFKINSKKTRLQKRGTRQVVTGITVNDKLNVAHKYIRSLRSLLYIWEKYGYKDAFTSFYKHYKQEKGYIKKGEPIMENVIEGNLNYIKMVKGDNDKVYLRLKNRYEKLEPSKYKDLKLIDNLKDKNDFAFACAMSLNEFGKYFNTDVIGYVNKNNKIICKADIFDKKVNIFITKDLNNSLHKFYPDLKQGDSILLYNKDNKEADTNYYICLCSNKGKNFWLISDKRMFKNKVLKWRYISESKIDKMLKDLENGDIKEAINTFIIEESGKFDPSFTLNLSQLDLSEFIWL